MGCRWTPRVVADEGADEEPVMRRYLTVGLTVLAGAALFEAALIPGVVIGAAAVLGPRYLLGSRRRLRRAASTPARRTKATATRRPSPSTSVQSVGPAKFRIGQAVAKTVTFRIIVTTLDFTTNYVVIGQLNTAAGLSAFNLIAGPLFYLVHETAWNYLGPPETDDGAVALQLVLKPESAAGGLRISRPLAKTITFRTIASIFDFIVNYVVVRDIAVAAGLSAFAFVVGPFVYFAHERAWDHFSASREAVPLLPPPARP
jgi:uncharacterized membrane protein